MIGSAPLLLAWTLAASATEDIVAAANPTPLNGVIDTVASLGMVSLIFGVLCCLVRLWRGPSIPDRAMALDVLTFQVVGLVLVMALILRNTAFFDVMLVVGIMGFVGTVAFAQYAGAIQPPRDDAPPPPNPPAHGTSSEKV